MVRMTPEGPFLSEEDKIQLAKAKMLNELECTYGYDPEKWIKILKSAEKRLKTEPTHTAILRLLEELKKVDH